MTGPRVSRQANVHAPRPGSGMTEDELLDGITGALTAGGWMWRHERRSDLAQQMGTPGWPDIFAIHEERGLVWIAELKAEKGRMEPGQSEWIAAFQYVFDDPDFVGVIRPADYDDAWRHLVGDRLIERTTA